MKKKILIITCILCSFYKLNAQLLYNFETQVGSYNALISSVSAPLTAAFFPSKTLLDESFSNNISIGFSFQYNGINYSQIHLNSNGFATLGTPFTAGTTSDPQYEINELRSASGQKGTIKPIIAPFWDNLLLSSASGISYLTSGVSPNRVFTAQWQNMVWQSGTAAISFQVKLFETSNNVEFNYQQESDFGGASKSASIGISSEKPQVLDEETAPLTYLSLNSSAVNATVNTQFETDNITTKPATGQTFRFTPNSCMPASGIYLKGYTSNSVTLSWTALQGATNYEITISNIDVQPVSGSTIATNTFTYSNLSENTKYYFYIKNSCGTIWNKFTFSTTAIETIPYVEDFETTLENLIPEKMTSQTLNNPFADSYWQSTDLLNAASGTKKMISSSPFVDAKSWLFTPSFNFVAGANYILTYKVSSTGGSNAFEVKYGTKAGQEFMLNNLLTENISATSYATKTINFKPTTSGEHTIGFANKSVANNQIVLLDDISLTFVAAPLPIRLLSFKVNLNEDKQTLLQWENSQEIGVSHFEIEKSIDGKIFNELGKTFAQISDSKANKYEYYDRNPEIGINYYRLKIVDNDGKFSYSPIGYVHLKENHITELYPNPSDKEVYLKMQNTDNVVITAYQLDGQILPISYSLFSKNVFKITTSSPPVTGIYIINISSPSETRILKWAIR